MAKLQLSERFRNAIDELRRSSEEQFAAIVDALSAVTRPNSETVAATMPSGLSDPEEVVQAVFALHHTLAQSDVTQERFLTDLVETMKTKWPAETASDDIRAFRTRVTRLLGVESIATVTKASRVLTDYERAFYDVKILSDLRPVFPTEPASGPIGMGIVHTLEIQFHKNGSDHDKFFVALTTTDLKKLRSALDRAELKVGMLRDGLTQSGVRYLEGD